MVTLAWSADAAPGELDSTFVPTPGCRAFDYRPAPNQVGPRSTPLAAGEVYTQQITGGVGDCTGSLAVPADAVAVAMNVTAVNPTAQTNLRLYPANLTDVPTLSNLNVSAGQAPFPNKVDVALSPGGAINIFNFKGEVFIVGDVVGYYTNSSLTDIDTRLTAVEALASSTAAVTDGLVAAQPFADEQRRAATTVTDPEAVVTMELDPPVDGHYTLIATTYAFEATEADEVLCSISTQTDPAAYDTSYNWRWRSSGLFSGSLGIIAGTRVIPVAQGAPITVGYVCGSTNAGGSGVNNTTLTAIFTPTP